jgi:hypothetical protein
MTFHYYEHPGNDHDGDIAPTQVIAFGTRPLVEEDIDEIMATVRCTTKVIRGLGVDGGPPCDGANPGFIVVLLNINTEDATITI